MVTQTHRLRLAKCTALMQEAGFAALLLTKPANMFYLTGDGRLCAYAMITQDGEVALGVPSTDVEDVKRLAHFDHLVGFEDEAGMIHSIAHYFEHFGIRQGKVGLEYTLKAAGRHTGAPSRSTPCVHSSRSCLPFPLSWPFSGSS
jgi:Xaa-Pro aminopeptidase